MPIAVSFVYNIKPVNSKVVPFAGLDIGAYKLWKSINYGWTSFTDDEWHFGLAPKLGVIFSLAKIPVYLAAKFNVLTRTKKYDDNYYLGIQLGIALKR
jgi:hypothetical protein